MGLDGSGTRDIFMLVVDNAKVPAVRQIVETHDSEGVMVVMEAAELLGRGH